MNKTALFALAFSVTASLAVGCGGEIAADEKDDAKDAPATEDTENARLELSESTTSRVVGRFSYTKGAIKFAFAREMSQKHFLISAEDGRELIDSVMHDDGTHETKLLGGKLIARGVVGQQPTYEGDEHAMAEIDAMPEGRAITLVQPALAISKVDRELLPIDKGVAAGIKTMSGFNSCKQLVGRNDYATCGTWFFGPTILYAENYSSYFNLFYIDGQRTVVPSWRINSRDAWYWARAITAVNYGYCPTPYCGSYNVWSSPVWMKFWASP